MIAAQVYSAGSVESWTVAGAFGQRRFVAITPLLIIGFAALVLAQMGSYVPARSAVIGTVDRLFSRVGASDDLARGRSTFMVEMVETAAILNLLGVAAVRLGEFQAAFGFALVTREGQSGPFGERQKRRHDNRH